MTRENFQMSGTTDTARKSVPLNFLFFPLFPSLIAFGLLIAAVSIVAWRIEIPLGSTTNNAIVFGLFQVCSRSHQLNVADVCTTSQEFALAGGALSDQNNDLEQATKGMLILSILLLALSSAASLLLGMRRFERNKGFLICFGAHFFTGVCIMSGMITYTLLLESLQEALPTGTFMFPQHSYFLAWFAMSLSFLSAILSLIGGIVKR